MLSFIKNNYKKFLPLQLVLFYVFIASGLIVNFVQFLTLIIWPFNKKLYRKLNTHLAYCLWSELTFLAQHWSGSTCDIFIDDEDFKRISKENCICIMNHKYDVDWLMGWIVCQQTGLLSGSKIIGKSSLRLIPLIGWCWLFTESIFIKRKWEDDQKKLIEGLDNILNDYPDDYYFNILLFCEGTRFTKSKHEQSLKIAKEKGLPQLKHHLLPRTKGFSLLARGARQLDAVYDLTIGIENVNKKPADLNAVRNGIPLKSELYVRRFSFKDIPESEEESAKFIHKLYVEKDEIYDVYARTGSFESLGKKKRRVPLNYYDLYISLTWVVLLCVPMFYWFVTFVSNASFLANLVLFFAIFLSSFGINMFLAVTKSDTGSEYGLESKKKQDNSLKTD